MCVCVVSCAGVCRGLTSGDRTEAGLLNLIIASVCVISCAGVCGGLTSGDRTEAAAGPPTTRILVTGEGNCNRD